MQNIYNVLVSGLAFWLADSVGWVEITYTTIVTGNKLADELLMATLIGIIFTVIGRLYLNFASMWLYSRSFERSHRVESINTAISSYTLKFYLANLLVGPIGFLAFWIFMPSVVNSSNFLLVPIFGFIVAFFWESSNVDFSRRVNSG